MKNDVIKFEFDGQTVDFLPMGKDVMVNATQMAKVFGREMKDFNKLESVKKFIDECLISEESSLIGVKKREDLIDSTRNSGTFMHRILALKFAAWLNPKFEVWVYSTVYKILYGWANEQREAVEDKLRIQKEKTELRSKLIKENPGWRHYFDLEEQEKAAISRKKKASIQMVNQISLDFGK